MYNVGAEPAKNPEYASRLLQSLLATNSNRLVIIATLLTKSTFETTYGITFVNSIHIKPQKEDKWI